MNSHQTVTLTHEYAPFSSGKAPYVIGLVASPRSLGCDVVIITSDYSHDNLDVIGAEESNPGAIFPCAQNSTHLPGEIGKSVEFRSPAFAGRFMYGRDSL